MTDLTTEFSQSLGALAKALAKAQGELEDAKKDAVNPAFKRGNDVSRYASLASVRAAITPVFSKHGLSVTQLNEPHGDAGVCVVTLLLHESGEWIRSRLFVPVTKKDAQGFGSALSYARRYALAAIANIAADDDDGEEASAKPTIAKPAETKGQPVPPTSIDLQALVTALETAKDAAELAAASEAVAKVKPKLSKADLDRCRAALTNRTRELGQAA